MTAGFPQVSNPTARTEMNLWCFPFFFFFNLFFFFSAGSSLLLKGFLLLQWVGAAFHCGPWASHCSGFSCCRAHTLGARAPAVGAHRFSCPTQHVVSSQTSDQTCVPFIDRQTPNHCTVREVPLWCRLWANFGSHTGQENKIALIEKTSVKEL